MARKPIYNRVILEYQLCLTAYKLNFTDLTTVGQSVSNTMTIHDKKNTKSMDINYTATLNDDDTINFQIEWSNNDISNTQSFTLIKSVRQFKYCTECHYFFIKNDKRYRNIYYYENKFQFNDEFQCRTERRYLSTKKRNMLVVMNPPQYTGKRPKRKFISTKGTPTKYAKAYENYQIKLNDYLMEMYELASSKEKEQLNKFIKWSEQIKESINKMQ